MTSQYQSDEDSSQAGHCIRPTTPDTARHKEVRPKSLLQTSFQTSGNSSNNSVSQSQNRGGGAIVVSQAVPGGTTPRRIANDLRRPIFNGNRPQDPDHYIFVCEAIWTVMLIHDQDAQIDQLATNFRDQALVWYMKFQITTPVGHIRTLDEIKTALILEFKKPKSES